MAEQQTIRLQQPFKGKVTSAALSDQPDGTVIDSRDVLPVDCKTSRRRLSVRPGYSAVDSLSGAAGFAILGNAYDEPGGIQLFAFTSSNAYKFSSGAWSNVGSITSSTSRTIHGASYGQWLFIACNAPYKYVDYDSANDGSPDWAVASWTATTAGTIPPNCRIVASYGARIALLADPDTPHVVNFSAVDDPFDWDTSGTTSGAAVSISIGEAATCGFEHNKNCFVVGTHHGMWIFRGNPKSSNALLEKFSFVTGPINSSAWCKAADDWTYYIGLNGLYKMPPGCGDPPQEVSRNLIPSSLIGLDGVNSKAYLVYNERFRGVEIHIQGTNAASWFYDVDGGGFWPITAPGSGILAAFRYGPLDSATASGSLIGTSSGVMRLNNATALGGSDAAYATVLNQLAEIGHKGQIVKMVPQFSTNTDDNGVVTVAGGSTAEEAVTLPAGRKETVTIGELQDNNYTWYPKVGGTFAVTKITQASTSAYWALEGASLDVKPAGLERGG